MLHELASYYILCILSTVYCFMHFVVNIKPMAYDSRMMDQGSVFVLSVGLWLTACSARKAYTYIYIHNAMITVFFSQKILHQNPSTIF